MNLIALNSERHRDLRVDPAHGLDGDHVRMCPVVTAEFAEVSADMPILLTRHGANGQAVAVALMGIDDDENLYLEAGQWLSGHKPLSLRHEPFFARLHRDQPEILIDMASPRVGRHGERLFDDDGRATPYLDYIGAILADLVTGQKTTAAFVDRLLDFGLLEPAELTLDLPGGERTLDDCFTISRDALATLSDDAVVTLHRLGDLELIHLMLASLTHLKTLERLKRARQSRTRKTAT